LSPSAARDLLRHVPGIARGFTARIAPRPIPTGVTELDRLLGGGVPRGAVTEIVGAPCSGRTSLAYAVAARITIAGEVAAYVDLPDTLDPEHAAAAGIDLARLLWIRPPTLQSALAAAEHVLGTGGFGLVVVDVDLPRIPAHRIGHGAWLRLARAAAHARCVLLVTTHTPTVGTFAAARLEIERRRTLFHAAAGPAAAFDALASTVHVRKCRGHASVGSATVTVAAAA
jgi:hypothetical protein